MFSMSLKGLRCQKGKVFLMCVFTKVAQMTVKLQLYYPTGLHADFKT